MVYKYEFIMRLQNMQVCLSSVQKPQAIFCFPNLNIFSLAINLLQRKNNNNIKPDEDGLFLADLTGLFFSSIFPDWENFKMYKVIHYPKSLKVFKVLEIEYTSLFGWKGLGTPSKCINRAK